MDAADENTNPELSDRSSGPSQASDAPSGASAVARQVSGRNFQEMVREAIDGVGGTLLFQMLVGADDEGYHAAAAAVGKGAGRNFLLLTMPAGGGQLKVESTAQSDDPLARLAESYAGLMDVLKVAA